MTAPNPGAKGVQLTFSPHSTAYGRNGTFMPARVDIWIDFLHRLVIDIHSSRYADTPPAVLKLARPAEGRGLVDALRNPAGQVWALEGDVVARGRNDWFKPARLQVELLAGRVNLGVSSVRPASQPPLQLTLAAADAIALAAAIEQVLQLV